MTSGMEFPFALFQLLTNGQPVEEAGQVKERVSVAMFFVEKSDFDFDAIENETIIHRCKERAFAWISSLASSPLVTQVTSQPAEEAEPGILLCFSQPGETLWDIAKRYRISQSAILSANHIPEGELPAVLLIPH
jgi:hypothetical protein